jgi:hypothetical protein
METSYTLRDMEIALRCLEARRRLMRESYYRHKEKRQAYAKERHAQKLAEQGKEPQGRRGRPSKKTDTPPPIENEPVAVNSI